MNLLARLLTYLRRRRRARRLGVRFTRSGSWRLPTHASIHGKKWVIRAPQDKGTEVAFFDIFLNDCYGAETASRPVKTVLDIGAHAGFFGVHARSLFPDAVIHAYEPNPQMHEFLEHQARVGAFTFFPEAVGQRAGRVQVDAHEDSVQTRCRVTDVGGSPQVAFPTCVERLGGRIDLLKMDCEGAEWEILENPMAWSAVRHLRMEYHLSPGRTTAELTSKVISLGFRILRLSSGSRDYGLLWAIRKYPSALRPF